MTGVKQSDREAVFSWKWFAIHLIGEERIFPHRLFQRNRCVIVVRTAENDHFCFRFRIDFFQQLAQPNSFPYGVAHLFRADRVADTLQGSHRRDGLHRGDVFKSQLWYLFFDETGDRQSPCRCVKFNRIADL